MVGTGKKIIEERRENRLVCTHLEKPLHLFFQQVLTKLVLILSEPVEKKGAGAFPDACTQVDSHVVPLLFFCLFRPQPILTCLSRTHPMQSALSTGTSRVVVTMFPRITFLSSLLNCVISPVYLLFTLYWSCNQNSRVPMQQARAEAWV